MNTIQLRDRYLRDPLPIRLGNLASSLMRLSSNAVRPASHDHVVSVIDECKHFIEWTGAEADLSYVEDLVGIQLQLAAWQKHWDAIRNDSNLTAGLSAEASASAQRVLQWSGLLDQE